MSREQSIGPIADEVAAARNIRDFGPREEKRVKGGILAGERYREPPPPPSQIAHKPPPFDPIFLSPTLGAGLAR